MAKHPELYKSTKQESHRQKRIAEEVRDILSQIIIREELRVDREHEDKEMESPRTPVTITHVQISPDLRNANVFIMPLGGLEKAEWIHYMKHCANYLRWRLSKELQLRIVPVLRFQIDDVFDQAQKIDDLIISTVKRDGGEDE